MVDSPLRSRITAAVAALRGAPVASARRAHFPKNFRTEAQTRSYIKTTEAENAREYHAWSAGVQLIATAIAGMPMYVVRRDKENPLYEGKYENGAPFRRANMLLDQPSRYLSREDFFSSLMRDMLNTGNGYALLMRDGDDTPLTLVNCEVTDRRAYRDDVRFVNPAEYRVRLTTEVATGDMPTAVTRKRNLLRIYWAYDPRIGKSPSPLDGGLEAVLLTALSAQIYQQEVFKSGPHVLGVLSGVSESPEDHANFESRLKEKSGPGSAWAMHALPEGVTYQATGYSPVDPRIEAYLRFADAQVAKALTIPPVVLSEAVAGANIGSGLAEHYKRFVRDGLRRHINGLQSALTSVLLRPAQIADGYSIRVDASDYTGIELERLQAMTSAAASGAATINEARGYTRRLLPLDDGDRLLNPMSAAPTRDDTADDADDADSDSDLT